MCISALVACALLAFLGYLADAAVLLGFFMASVSLWYLPEEEISLRSRKIMLAAAGFVILLGTAKLAGHFMAEYGTPGGLFSGASFLMLGLALIFMHSRTHYWLTRVMIGVMLVFSLLAGVSYAYGIRSTYVIGPYLSLAPVFLILCTGLLFAHREHGFTGIITRETAGAVMARHLLPAAIFLPFLLGWLAIKSQSMNAFGPYDVPFGLALFVVSSIVIFGTLIWWNSKLLDGIDLKRRFAENDLRSAYTQTEQLLSAITSILIGITVDGKVTYWNPVAESIFRIVPQNVLQKPLSHCGVELDFMKILDGVKECVAKNRLVHVDDVSFVRPDGQKGFLGFSVIPIKSAEKSSWFLLFGAEITKRKLTNQLKDDFISTVSHELRTPLAITKEGISLILDKVVGPLESKQEAILVTAKENIDRLARIIDSLLDVSKIEAGRVDLKKKLLDLGAIVRSSVAPFERRLQEKGLELRLSIPGNEIQAYVDPDKMTQVITNLMGNAIKFTEKGFVQVTVTETQDEIRCAVSDSGVGVSTEDMPKLFTKFQQFGRMHGAGEKGTGLGLTIVKGIVELHNGQIRAESTLGKGTTISFTLPKYLHEKLLKESVRDGMRIAVKNGSQTSLVIGTILDFEHVRRELPIDQLNVILEDVRGILKSSLRQSGDDSFQDLGEVAVVLTDCGKESAEAVKKRLRKISEDYLVKKSLNGRIRLHFGVSTYPDDAPEEEGLIQKAKEDALKHG